jgi:hypothetical protein
MRLVREYAVEPAAIAIDAQTATQILDLFGWHRGRVVSACPPHWLRHVVALLSANKAIPPIRRKSLVEKKLKYLQENGFVQSRRTWNSNSRWIIEAERSILSNHSTGSSQRRCVIFRNGWSPPSTSMPKTKYFLPPTRSESNEVSTHWARFADRCSHLHQGSSLQIRISILSVRIIAQRSSVGC